VLPVDEKLKDLLRDEAPGIMALFVKGFLEWQSIKMSPPACVTDATHAYRNEQDSLKDFIAEECTEDKDAMESTRTLHERYSTWCKHRKLDVPTENMFARKLTHRGFLVKEGTLANFRIGIKFGKVATPESIEWLRVQLISEASMGSVLEAGRRSGFLSATIFAASKSLAVVERVVEGGRKMWSLTGSPTTGAAECVDEPANSPAGPNFEIPTGYEDWTQNP
jgi:hypothetical protein